MAYLASRFTDIERTLQSRYAIVGPNKVIAITLGVAQETVSRWKNADWPIPAFQAFAASHCQGNWVYLQTLAERWRAILSPQQRSVAHWSASQLFFQVLLSHGPFLALAEKVKEGRTLEDEEQRQMEEEGRQIIEAIGGLIEQARQKRREQGKQKEKD